MSLAVIAGLLRPCCLQVRTAVRPLVGTILRQKDPTEGPYAPTSVISTAVLDVRRSTAEHLARLLRDHRAVIGNRRRRRALGCFRQAVLILRWLIDGTRLAQLASDNALSTSTAYRYLHEGAS